MIRYEITSANKKMMVEVQSSASALVDGTLKQFHITEQHAGSLCLTADDRMYNIYCQQTSESSYDIYLDNEIIPVEIEDSRSKLIAQLQKTSDAKSGINIVRAPMPGLIAAIEVSVGDLVEPGTGLIILEAMKMENEIRSTIKGKVKAIEVKPKTTIEKNQVLIRIEQQE